MDISQKIVQNLQKKLTGSQKLHIAYGDEKLDTKLSQVNASQNSRQTIGNTYNSFQLVFQLRGLIKP